MQIPKGASDRRTYVKTNVLPQMDLRPFINGEYCNPESEAVIGVLDPMTNETIANIPACSELDVAKAVSAARRAFESGVWSGKHPRERAKILLRLADLIERNMESLVLLESIDTGKPVSGVRAWDIPNAAEVYRYYAGWADKITGDVHPPVTDFVIQSRLEPIGVCAAIIPWNFPFPCIAWKIAPALAVGCTVVLKPAERAPLSSQFLASLINEAGFPNGVINIVTGFGSIAGNALVSNPEVNKITFTGSTNTAKEIIKASLNHLPRLSFELGGKSPNVIMSDADLDKAVSGAISAMFSVQGQNCCAGSRMFVHRDIYDKFLKMVIEKISSRRLGDPLDDSTEQGPQIDKRHFRHIAGYVHEAISEGASCIVGGDQANAGELFYSPTVLSEVTDGMRIAKEEVFGPVGCVFQFSSLDEVIERANDTNYGLAAAIWTSNSAVAEKFVKGVRAGTCWVNCYNMIDTVAPWGGFKQSGYGRELGAQALHNFLETKTVFYSY